MKAFVSLLVILVICTALPATADIINVPADQPTIQAGIVAALPGDEVVVADGTYTGVGNRDIVLNETNFGITVRSANGPDNCIIDCQGSAAQNHLAFIFPAGDLNNDSVISGFTLTNGYSDYGGAVCILGNNRPTISKCIITNNYTDEDGGGIAMRGFYSGAAIVDNIISNNSAGKGGGGIYGGF